MRYDILNHCELERRPNGTIVHLSPDVDVLNFQEVLEQLVEVIQREKPARLLVNVEYIRYLQSAALGRVATLAARLQAQGGRLQMCGLIPELHELITRSRLDQLIDIHANVHSACETWPPPTAAVTDAPPVAKESSLSGLSLSPLGVAATTQTIAAATPSPVLPSDHEAVRAWQFVSRDEVPEKTLAWGVVHDLFPQLGSANRALRSRRVTIQPNSAEPFHRHAESEELLYVLRGRVEQWIERTKQSLSAGDVAYIPVNAAHATFNDTEDLVELLQVSSSIAAADRDHVELGNVEPWRSVLLGREYRGFDIERTDGILIATVTSKSIVDPLGLQQFKAGLMSILQRESPKVLLLDLTHVDFLSSAVLGSLVVAWQDLGKRGGRGGLCGLTAGIRKVFEISRLDRTIPLFGTRTDALAALARGP